MVSVSVSAVGRPIALAKDLPTTLEFPGKAAENVTISDLKQALAAKFPKFYPSRQKLTLKGEKKALTDEATLKDAGIVDGDELSAKDLGPQASWTTVFVVEYIGPLIIHPLVYHFPNIFYGGPVQHSLLQRYVYAMVMLHFLKREYETLFVHRFSHGTMPFAYIFRKFVISAEPVCHSNPKTESALHPALHITIFWVVLP
ncbi:hypothetical protein NLI96_g10946 [Meripilus lineatus]|uniref:Ubiquitin-like domain-containing protein n=1 Tax=Meripilus lineatus TaxID=2056292 RepID=A0AAD5Y8U6_9APHY|nr:hypothetical protein NLI96_g10946 [Physisporinus lineatus]